MPGHENDRIRINLIIEKECFLSADHDPMIAHYKKSSFYSLWTRYKFIPLYWKILPIVILLAGTFFLDQIWVPSRVPPEILHRLYYLPIVLSGLLFGFRGGVLAAVVVTGLFIPHWVDRSAGSGLHGGHLDEVVLFFAFGILIGLLVDRERLESELRQDQEHLAVLGEAAATIAHELKNPVITIGAYIQRILQKTDLEDPNRERLAVIRRECQRIEVMLQDMIHFSRPIKPEFSFVDINHLIQEVLKIIHPRAEQNQIHLSSNLEGDLPSIQVDQTRITQVLHNLILNAIQASGPEKPILVSTRRQKGRVIIEILDQGCGIPADCQEKIFAPFFSTKKDGSGLGLAVSKRIIELHQGRLSCRANQPQGSIFTISLPLGRKGSLSRSGISGESKG
jgi:two-component system sensor histidine kinase HydH